MGQAFRANYGAVTMVRLPEPLSSLHGCCRCGTESSNHSWSGRMAILVRNSHGETGERSRHALAVTAKLSHPPSQLRQCQHG